MTPYAILLMHPAFENDKSIARIYYALAKQHHPDAMALTVSASSEWYRAKEAYAAVKTLELRDAWYARQMRLSGLCKACEGYGVTTHYKRGVSVCEDCAGQGRKTA